MSEFQMEANEMVRIQKGTFLNCSSLTRIIIPEGIEKVEQDAFRGSGLQECLLPVSLCELDKGVFAETALKEISIPFAVDTLPEDVFASCRSLERIHNEGSIRAIGPGALSGCEKLKCIEVAEGAILYRNIFIDSPWGIKYSKERKKTVTKSSYVTRYVWDTDQKTYVAKGKIEFIPVLLD